MPKKETDPGFDKNEWLNKAKEKVMAQAWGTGVIWNNGVLFVELVRVNDTEDVMIRIRTPKIGNAVKLTRREHIDALIELAKAIANNERNVADKLEAIKEILRTSGKRQVDEI